MAQFPFFDWKNVAVQVFGLSGTTLTKIGGTFHRESPETTSSVYAQVNRVATIFSRLFAVHKDRIYEFDSGLAYVPLTSIGATFLTYQKGDTWSAAPSGATGTFQEDGVTGDTHFLSDATGTTVALNDVITITSGVANGQTATATAAQAKGGQGSELGEWKVVFTISEVPEVAGFSGFLGMNVNGKHQLVLAVNGGTSEKFLGIKHDPEFNTWTEVDTGFTWSSTEDVCGKGELINDAIYWAVEQSGTNQLTWIVYNPSTDAVGEVIASGINSGSDGQDGINHGLVGYRGQIFAALQLSSAVGDLGIFMLGGGVFSKIIHLDGGLGTSTGPDFNTGTTRARGGSGLFVMGDKLWILVQARDNSNYRYWALACTLINNSLSVDNMRTGTSNPIAAGDVAHKLAQFLLPSALAPAIPSTTSLNQNSKIFTVRDQSTNDPDGNDRQEIFFISDYTGGTTDVVRWTENIFTNLTFTIDWSSAVSVGSDIYEFDVTAGNANDASVDDWIAEQDDLQIFRVDSIPSSVKIRLHNPGDEKNFPAGSGQSLTLNAMSQVGIATGIATLAPPAGDEGGGAKVFTTGQLSAMITDIIPSGSKEQIEFMLNGGGSSKNAKFFHGDVPDKVASKVSTVDTPSVGTVVSNVNQGLTADGTTKYTILHDLPTDNIDDGALLRRVVRAFD